MLTKKIIILLFILFTTFNLLNSMKIYKKDEYGISFEYPDEVILDELHKYSNVNKYSDEFKSINEKYILNVYFSTYREFFKYSSLKLKDKDLNEKNIRKILYEKRSDDKIIIYNNKKIGNKFWNYLEINQFEVNRYYVVFYIVKGEYVISIRLTYYDLLTKIPPRYPNYFDKNGNNNEWAFKWDKNMDTSDRFFNFAISHSDKAALELVKLFDYANILEKSLKLYGKMYTPNVNVLRFRETPSLDGKYIRTLKENERLELLETGKEDTVNGVKGHWIKVKTEQSETGWCFDGYLEEVK